MLPAGPQTPGHDKPTSARITNLMLGGSYHTAADEAAEAELRRACPQVRRMAADGRLFAIRVAAWAADQDITQILDLGAGISPGPQVHDVARSVRPGSRVCYVDSDPEVTDWLRDVMPGGDGDGVAVVNADLRHAAALWRNRELREVIDPGQPACVILSLVLHLMAPTAARKAVASWARLVAPGSVIAVGAPCVQDELSRRRMEAVFPAYVRNFTPAEIAAVLGGLDIEPPGIAPTGGLRPGWGDIPGRDPGPAYVLGGIGRKPGPGRALSAGQRSRWCAPGEQGTDGGQARPPRGPGRCRGTGRGLLGVDVGENVIGQGCAAFPQRPDKARHAAPQVGTVGIGGDLGHQGAPLVKQAVHPVPQVRAPLCRSRFIACRLRHHAVHPPLALPCASPVRQAPLLRFNALRSVTSQNALRQRFSGDTYVCGLIVTH